LSSQIGENKNSDQGMLALQVSQAQVTPFLELQQPQTMAETPLPGSTK